MSIAAVLAIIAALVARADKAERRALRVERVERILAARDLHRTVENLPASGLDRLGRAVDVVDADIISPQADRQLGRLGHDRADARAAVLDEAVFAHLTHVHV